MKSERNYSDYLHDMLDACLKARNFIQDMSSEEFARDEKTQFAVIRALEIIGEASKKFLRHIKIKLLKFRGGLLPGCATK